MLQNAWQFIFISLALCSCINPGKFELEGKVVDEMTRKNVPNRKIVVQELVQGKNRLIAVSTDEFLTDSTGHFKHLLNRHKEIYLYNFSVVGDTVYGFSGNTLGLTDLKRNGKFLTFYLTKLTDFTIAIERKSRTSYNDTLYVSWESNGIDGRKLYPYKINNYGHHGNSNEVEFRWIGGNIQSAIKTKVYADKPTIIHWELFRAGEIKRINDTIVCSRDVKNFTYFKY
jgi:hypothetical protein